MTVQHERFGTHRSVGFIALLVAGAGWGSAAGAEDYSKTYSVSARPTVHVVTNDGSVHVTSGDSARVEFHVEYQGFTLDKTLHIESAQRGDRVELTARISKLILALGQTRRLHIEIRMPRDGDLEVETGDGAVTASALSGHISLHTRDGAITAEHLTGTLDLRTGDGGVTVSSLAGDVHLGTGDGAIHGHDIDGRCEAISHDGGIQLAGRFDALLIKSGDGSVEARALPGSKVESPWSISTGSGSATVAVPATLAADLDASTGDEHVRLDIPVEVEGTVTTSKVRGKIHGGGQRLTIRTGDGSIHLLAN